MAARRLLSRRPCRSLTHSRGSSRASSNTPRDEGRAIGHGETSSPPAFRSPPTMSDIVIVSAARTAVGSFNGALASMPAHELGRIAIQAAIAQAGISASDVEEVIMGQVLQAGAGQGPARQASVNAGVPV